MTKPTIFFSHSSKDKTVLARLKTLFSEKTGGTIDVFLSSDGQSIPLGRNWVHRVESALESTALMVVFLTPHSINSTWIYFEAGFAYSKGLRVVPVGLLGVDLTQVPPPLGLLQGFNIKSNDGLDNLIALANSEFNHAHSGGFSADEFHELLSLSDNIIHGFQEGSASLIQEIYTHVSGSREGQTTLSDAMTAISSCLTKHHIDHNLAGNTLLFHGVAIAIDERDKKLIYHFSIDPILLDRNAPLLNDIALEIANKGFAGTRITAKSVEGYFSLRDFHSVSARVYGTNVKLLDERHYQYNTNKFSLRSGSSDTTPRAFIDLIPEIETFPISDIRDLMNILYERGVIYRDDGLF